MKIKLRGFQKVTPIEIPLSVPHSLEPQGRAKFINEWTRDVMRHRSLPELKKFARMIRKHQELILNYFHAKKEFSSGIVEGFNNKAKLAISGFPQRIKA